MRTMSMPKTCSFFGHLKYINFIFILQSLIIRRKDYHLTHTHSALFQTHSFSVVCYSFLHNLGFCMIMGMESIEIIGNT